MLRIARLFSAQDCSTRWFGESSRFSRPEGESSFRSGGVWSQTAARRFRPFSSRFFRNSLQISLSFWRAARARGPRLYGFNNARRDLQDVPKHQVHLASFFVPQTCILSSITAKNQIHWSKVQSFTISGSPATRVPASQEWIVQWVEILMKFVA